MLRSLGTSQVVHQAGTYLGVLMHEATRNMSIPPDGMLVYHRVIPQH